MLTYFQAVILGLLQGVSELFPVSSLGHSVIVPGLLGWSNIKSLPTGEGGSDFLTFLVATHLATAFVLLGFFWKDWKRLLKAMGRSFVAREIREDDTPAKTGWLVLVGTIPAGVLGAFFEKSLRSVFTSEKIAALFLIANGLMLFGFEALRRRKTNLPPPPDPDENIAKMSWWKALGVGGVQAIALIPGFSRSGAAMGGGLLAGLDNEDAARFSFLLATPIIGAAALLKLPELFSPASRHMWGPCAIGMLCSGLTAYLAVRFLMKYFETHRLTAFAAYCVVAGVISSAIFQLR